MLLPFTQTLSDCVKTWTDVLNLFFSSFKYLEGDVAVTSQRNYVKEKSVKNYKCDLGSFFSFF